MSAGVYQLQMCTVQHMPNLKHYNIAKLCNQNSIENKGYRTVTTINPRTAGGLSHLRTAGGGGGGYPPPRELEN